MRISVALSSFRNLVLYIKMFSFFLFKISPLLLRNKSNFKLICALLPKALSILQALECSYERVGQAQNALFVKQTFFLLLKTTNFPFRQMSF